MHSQFAVIIINPRRACSLRTRPSEKSKRGSGR